MDLITVIAIVALAVGAAYFFFLVQEIVRHKLTKLELSRARDRIASDAKLIEFQQSALDQAIDKLEQYASSEKTNSEREILCDCDTWIKWDGHDIVVCPFCLKEYRPGDVYRVKGVRP